MRNRRSFIPILVVVAFGAPLLLMAYSQVQSAPPERSLGIEAYPDARDLYAFAESQRVKYDWPAFGVGVIFRGKIVALGMAGERRIRTGDWATLHDRFVMASLAKSMTAALAAKLVEQGRLTWEERVLSVLPNLEDALVSDYENVTLEQLLGHCAGLDQWMRSNDTWRGWHRDHSQQNATEQRLAFAAAALRRQPKYPPGAQHYYCNDGYLIAGSMIETAAARPFEELANDYIFKPLKLESASYGLGSERQQSVLAWGHERGAFGRYRAVKPDPNEFGPQPFGSPAGFLYCSVPDMLRYVDLHLRGANGVATVLRPESFERLHAPLAGQSYALGWDVEVTRDSAGEVIERSIFHGGFTGRDRANMWFCPESGWGAVMVCNSGDGDGTEMGQAFHALLKEIGVTE